MTRKTIPDYVLHACRVARGLDALDPSQDPEIATLDPQTVYNITIEAMGMGGCARLIEQFIDDCGGSIVWETPPTVTATCQACGDTRVERSYYAGYGWRYAPCPYCVRAYTIDGEPTGRPQTHGKNA